ncbi:MAG TPA: hypothetical protein VFT91_10430 [Dehalococcoidia bacterium]|nr:hypothetical protein [Dehalococcoidia bacterium]
MRRTHYAVLGLFAAALALLAFAPSHSSTTAVEPSHHKVVFVQGISSQATCGTGMVDLTTPMRDFLLTTPWVQAAVPLQPDDFRYFSYDPGPTFADRYCNGDPVQPDYTAKDTCWSIDDVYTGPAGGQKTTTGAVHRLNQLIATLVSQDPLVKIDLVAHSQGGVVAAYWLQTLGNPANVNSLVTFDSPLGGLPALWSAVGMFNCATNGVNLQTERWYDSPRDMRDGSPTNLAVQGAPASAAVFTLRTSDPDIIIPDQAATFDGGACDSSADLVPSACAAPAGTFVDFYAPLGNHTTLWRSPIPQALDLLGCAVTADLTPCFP